MWRKEKSLGFLACQQIDISADRFCGALRLEVFQHLAVLHCNGSGYALYLFHVYLSVALCYDLRRGVPDAVDVHRQYAHCASRYVKLWQFHTACREPHTALRTEVLEAFVVVDEDERAVVLRAV